MDVSGTPSFSGPKPPPFTGAIAPPELGLVDGVVFGRQVNGMHPELLRRLVQAEQLAQQDPSSQEDAGIDTIIAYRAGSRSHSRGLAVDINYYANPYVMHESGEGELDRELTQVYHRIALLMLGRESVLPEEITRGAIGTDRTLRLLRELREESRAMIAYFRLMPDAQALERHLRTHPAGRDHAANGRLLPIGEPVAPLRLQQQMMRDYVVLAGRRGPSVPGLTYPTAPVVVKGDAPFAGDPTYRGPEMGFLSLSEPLVKALTQVGLRWGGTDMERTSGDLMHFYLPASEVAISGATAGRVTASERGRSRNNRPGDMR